MKRSAQDIIAWMRLQAPHGELASDSRGIDKGDIFFAWPGDGGDGRSHIGDAIERGAAAVVYEASDFVWPVDFATPALAVSDLQSIAGAVANGWYGQPDAAMFVAAVTGTNGKTSCSQWLANAMSRLHSAPAGVIGTLGRGLYRGGLADHLAETGYTTPDAILLQRSLRDLRVQGATALAIEASSIGLDQGRMNGLHVDVALLTNLTRDHLDYHGTMAEYEAAKGKLFGWPGLRHAVLNLDDAASLRLLARLQQNSPQLAVTGYTIGEAAPAGITLLRATDIRSNQGGTSFHLHASSTTTLVKVQLVGHFNVSNVLGVIGVLLAQGHPLRAVLDAVESLRAVPGRMQQFGGQESPMVVIDYAHTPDALEKTLEALRQVTLQRGGKLWCVFGCGGDRDPGKRPQMGAVAMLAEEIIITSDNPRSETPATIISQVLAGIDQRDMKRSMPLVIEDRAAAILWAVRHADKSDVILLAGKGHESYQEIRGKKLPFLDADHTAIALAARATTKGHS